MHTALWWWGGGHLRERGCIGRSGIRWTDNIKMDLEEVGWRYGLDGLTQHRDRWRAFVDAVMSLRVL